MLRKLAVAVAGVMLLPGLAAAQAPRGNLDVFNRVSSEVLAYPRYTVFDDVSIAVDGGAVTLTGKVTMPYKVKDIERRVSDVPGVTSVRNEITVLPVSNFDDALRYQVSRAIYGSPEFREYAAMVDPPIHIIVDSGRVTLTGVVNSNAERMMAQSLATTVNALSVVNRLKTDAEVEAELKTLD